MTNTTAPSTTTIIRGRVPVIAFQVVTIVTFVLALLAVAARYLVLFPQGRRLGLDDTFLMFATICLIAGTTLLLVGLDAIYFVEEMGLNDFSLLVSNGDAVDWLEKATFFGKINWAYQAITWTTIYSIKFSFLIFFSSLCNRLPRMELYRKIVVGLCVVAFIFAIVGQFVICPHLGLDGSQCGKNTAIGTSLAVGIPIITLDIVTDILIVLIPVILLWKVKLKTYQKLGLGVFLCLSTVMIIFAFVRAAGVHYYGSIDESWIYLWQQLEPTAAVTMFSLTAFRSVFTSQASRSSRNSPWKASIPNFIKKLRRTSLSSQELHLNDVSIPGGTMTGMQTVIEKGFDHQRSVNISHLQVLPEENAPHAVSC